MGSRGLLMGRMRVKYIQVSGCRVIQLELHPFLTAFHTEWFSRNWFQNDHLKEVEALLKPVIASCEVFDCQILNNKELKKLSQNCLVGPAVRLGFTLKPKRERQNLVLKSATSRGYKCWSIQLVKVVAYVCPRLHSNKLSVNSAFGQLLRNTSSSGHKGDISQYFHRDTRAAEGSQSTTSVSTTTISMTTYQSSPADMKYLEDLSDISEDESCFDALSDTETIADSEVPCMPLCKLTPKTTCPSKHILQCTKPTSAPKESSHKRVCSKPSSQGVEGLPPVSSPRKSRNHSSPESGRVDITPKQSRSCGKTRKTKKKVPDLEKKALNNHRLQNSHSKDCSNRNLSFDMYDDDNWMRDNWLPDLAPIVSSKSDKSSERTMTEGDPRHSSDGLFSKCEKSPTARKVASPEHGDTSWECFTQTPSPGTESSPAESSPKSSIHHRSEGNKCGHSSKQSCDKHDTTQQQRKRNRPPSPKPCNGFTPKRQKGLEERSPLYSLSGNTRDKGTKKSYGERQVLSLSDSKLEAMVQAMRQELLDIGLGKEYSERHTLFNKGGNSRRMLDHTDILRYFKEGQEDIVMDVLLNIFVQSKTSVGTADYVMRVILPEALTRIYHKVTGQRLPHKIE